MPPTRWKQEEEEGRGNHRQTLNSLTPPDCEWLLSVPRAAGILLPFPLLSNRGARKGRTAGHLQVKVTQSPALPRVLSCPAALEQVTGVFIEQELHKYMKAFKI